MYSIDDGRWACSNSLFESIVSWVGQRLVYLLLNEIFTRSV